MFPKDSITKEEAIDQLLFLLKEILNISNHLKKDETKEKQEDDKGSKPLGLTRRRTCEQFPTAEEVALERVLSKNAKLTSQSSEEVVSSKLILDLLRLLESSSSATESYSEIWIYVAKLIFNKNINHSNLMKFLDTLIRASDPIKTLIMDQIIQLSYSNISNSGVQKKEYASL